MIALLTYMFVGCIIAYGIFTILRELSHDIRYKRIQDDRDTDERRIAGEETSEVALNYLKIASETKDLP